MDLQEIFVECDTNKENKLELGINVVAEPSESTGGLKITKIPPGGAVDRNGLFKEGDVIVKVNGISLENMSFHEAQTLLKRELQPTITLTVRRPITEQQKDNKHFVEALNTRMVGVEHHIRLKKGPTGLGFKIAGRDNRSRAWCPVKITSIDSGGAAILDGNLKLGDMLLKVNGIDCTDKSQNEVAAILRKIQTDEYADILISRLDTTPPSDDSSSAAEQIESLVLDIPFNDTGSAGLGIHMKKPVLDDHGELVNSDNRGVRVANIMHGGAAWKDGRLQPNDELTAINGISLIGLSVAAVKETIAKEAVQATGPNAIPNVIRLSILRRIEPVSNERSFSSPITQASTSIEQNSSSKTNATKSPDTELTNVTHSQGTLSAFNAPQVFDSSSLNGSYRNLNISASLQSLEGELTEAEEAESFRRDGFGRQSMSEKRHAQLNAINTDTYRRSRKAKEDREQEEQVRLETERQKMVELANNRRSLNLSQIQHNNNRMPPSNCAMNSIALTLPKHYRQYSQATNYNYSNELPVDVQISREPCMTLEPLTNGDSSMGLSQSINNFQSPKIHVPIEINSTPRLNHHRILEAEVDSINKGSRHIFSSSSCFKCRSPGSCPHHQKSDEMSSQSCEERAPTRKEPDMASNSSGSKKGSSLFRFFKLGSRKEKKKKDDTVVSTNNSNESSTSHSESQSDQKSIARQDAKREQEKIDEHYRKFVQQRQQSPNGFTTHPRLQNQVLPPVRFALQRPPECHKYSNGNGVDSIRPQVISHSHHPRQQVPDVYMEKQQNINQPVAKFALRRPTEENPYRIDINSIQPQQYNQYIGQNHIHQKTTNHPDQNRLSMTTRIHPQRPPVCPQFLNNVSNGNINIAQPRQYYQYMNQQPYHHQPYINQQQNHHHQYINQPPLHHQYINQQPHLHHYNNQPMHPHQYNNQPSHHHQAMSIYLDQAHQHPSQIPTNAYLQYSQIL